MYTGTIKNIIIDRGFGFIASPGRPDTFFHLRDLDPPLEMTEALREMRVKFEIIDTDRGPRAKNVRPAD